MKKTSAWLMVLVLAFAASRLSAEDYDPDRWYGHFSYLIGYKGMESEWAPADEQVMFAGFDLDAQPPGWPVSLTLQLLVSTTDDIPDHPRFLGDFTSTLELNLGVRKVWRQNAAMQPFIGGGLSIISVATITDDGYWWSYEEDGDTGVSLNVSVAAGILLFEAVRQRLNG